MNETRRIPFKFLDSYTLADRDIFFGRERETEEIYSRLFYGKMLLIYGPSGSGKTSLLQCGVAARFGEQNWQPLFIRRRQHILQSMHAELERLAVTPFRKEKSIADKLYSLYLDFLTPIYLVFDQFEELFIFGSHEEKKEFVGTLKDILGRDDLNTRVIFSIREEYLASLSEFDDDLPALYDNRIRVEKMKKAQALSVITSPCEICAVDVEAGLAETAVERILSESATVELTWLQVLMDRLYKAAVAREGERPVIRQEDLDALGNLGDVLGGFLEEQLTAMPDPARGDAVLKTLISSEGTKRPMSLPEMEEALAAAGRPMTRDDILPVVTRLVSVRILADKDEGERYELKHDSLAAKIFERLTLTEREIQEVRQFVENAFKSYQKTGHLLGRKELAYVRRFEDRLALSGDKATFINSSKETLLGTIQLRRRISTFAALAFVALMCLCIFLAVSLDDQITSEDLAVTELSRKTDEPYLSLRNAILAYQNYKSPMTRRALFETFYELWEKKAVPGSDGKADSSYCQVFDTTQSPSPIVMAGSSQDGSYLFGILSDGSVMIWNRYGAILKNYLISNETAIHLGMSGNSEYLCCLFRDSTAALFTRDGRVLLRLKVQYDKVNPTRIFAFSPDSRQVAFTAPGDVVEIRQTRDGGQLQVLQMHAKPVTAVAYSPDGRFLATASKDHRVAIWASEKNQARFKIFSVIRDHKDIVWSVAFAWNGRYVITASQDSTVGLFDLNGKMVEPFSRLHKKKLLYCNAYLAGNDRYLVFDELVTADSCEKVTRTLPWEYRYDDLDLFTKGITFLRAGVLFQTRSNETRLQSHKQFFYHAFRRDFERFLAQDSCFVSIEGRRLLFFPANEDMIVNLVNTRKIFENIRKTKKIPGLTRFD